VKLALAIAVMCIATTASAETREGLQARGEALGREGKWGEAIHAFKSAEQIEHRAVHACLITLAYARREAWPQAEVFLSRCHDNAGEQLPEWVPQLDELIGSRVHSESLTELTIEVVPVAAAGTTLTASSFEPDELFTARTIHVPRGTLVIVAHAPGYPEQQRVLTIDSNSPQRLVIDMTAKPGPVEPPYARTLRYVGLATVGLGVVAAAAGIKFGLDARGASNVLSTHTGPWTHDDEIRFENGRTANRNMYIAYGVGAGLVVTGGVLYYLGARAHVAPVVGTHTAMLATWGTF